MDRQQDLRFDILVVAAGRGERAGASHEGPKQYRRIGHKAVMTRCLETFLAWPNTARITVAIHPDDIDLFGAAIAGLAGAVRISTVVGGATRQASVLAGLEHLVPGASTHVMIHDAVRPFFSLALLDRIAAAHQAGDDAVLPAMAVPDTLKRGAYGSHVAETVAREGLFGAQTPQSFRFDTILDAHRAAALTERGGFTDDASIAEWRKIPVRLVEGEADNIKLTLRRDIELADERLMKSALPDVRTGNGYDVHRLVAGTGVTLCGVLIPHDHGLDGHSDADVALHALTDALLATCGAGDIGDHFPPSDPQWRGAASRIFLEHAAAIVRTLGGTIMNADVSLIAEAPRIGPHRQAMREKLAEILGLDLERCSVKATTNERIGFVGRGEGIAAIATATVVYRRED